MTSRLAIERNMDKQLDLMRWLAGLIPEPPKYVPGGLAVAITRLRRRGWVAAEGQALTLLGRQKLNTWLRARSMPTCAESKNV